MMMEEIKIRPATEEDLETLYIFEQGVISAERPHDPTIQAPPVRYYNFDEMFTSPHIHLVVAEIDSILIGSGYARIEKSEHFLKHSEHAYLGFMYTDPQYRRRGINQKIIDELTKWARSKNITELRLEVYFGNSQAIKAYEKAGFIKHMLTMRSEVFP
jgi:ribosomal protein S18 acetylase RimI-like enzyme